MRISDWSSDVCSSDLGPVHRLARASPPYQPAEGGCRMTQKDVRPILYHCPDARSLRCLWAVEEAEIDVELRLLKFPPRAFEPDYRAVNPLMTIRSEEHTSELQSLMRISYAVFCL